MNAQINPSRSEGVLFQNSSHPLSLARTLSGEAFENRGFDTQGLVAVRDGICAGHGRDGGVKQYDSNHSARDSHRRGPSASPKNSSSQAARRYL